MSDEKYIHYSYDTVKTGLDALLAGMDTLGAFLSSAADAIVDLDANLAGQLAV